MKIYLKIIASFLFLSLFIINSIADELDIYELPSGGNVVSGDTAAIVAAQGVAGNGVTINTADKGMLVRINVNGDNRTGAILEKGTGDGQIIVLVNVGTHQVTMAAAGTSFVALGASCVIASGASVFCVYDSTTAKWYATET